jgi:ComF family protein
MPAGKFIQLASDFIGLVYPRLCVVCNGHLLKSEQGFCFSCEQELPRTYDELQPKENPVARVFWGRFPIEAGASCFIFAAQGPIQNLVHNLKYNGRKDAGVAAGNYYGNVLRTISPFLTADYILPVPLHEDKLLKRGYNQAACFAQGLSEAMNIPWSGNILVRLRATASQTRKSREQRWANVGDVFAVSARKKLEGKHVIIVDDVITTGATIEACVLPLLEIPGIRISVVSLAAARD